MYSFFFRFLSIFKFYSMCDSSLQSFILLLRLPWFAQSGSFLAGSVSRGPACITLSSLLSPTMKQVLLTCLFHSPSQSWVPLLLQGALVVLVEDDIYTCDTHAHMFIFTLISTQVSDTFTMVFSIPAQPFMVMLFFIPSLNFSFPSPTIRS